MEELAAAVEVVTSDNWKMIKAFQQSTTNRGGLKRDKKKKKKKVKESCGGGGSIPLVPRALSVHFKAAATALRAGGVRRVEVGGRPVRTAGGGGGGHSLLLPRTRRGHDWTARAGDSILAAGEVAESSGLEVAAREPTAEGTEGGKEDKIKKMGVIIIMIILI